MRSKTNLSDGKNSPYQSKPARSDRSDLWSIAIIVTATVVTTLCNYSQHRSAQEESIDQTRLVQESILGTISFPRTIPQSKYYIAEEDQIAAASR